MLSILEIPSRPARSLLILAVVLASLRANECLAKDYFLTIGGGYSPTGNQISLEKNVQYFQRLLDDAYEGQAGHRILFSDGKKPGRDLQFYDPEKPLPRLHELLGQAFDDQDDLQYNYRNHQVSPVHGPSSIAEWDRWIEEMASQLKPEDRVYIYATAHGAKSRQKKRPGNTYLYMWNREKLSVEKFATSLRKLPVDVPISIVMVQCYSGGFANTQFIEGNPDLGLDDHQIAGFFATIESRPAAGCTADIQEENYHEYSSSFWAGLSGKNRLGEDVRNCDFNQSGSVSLSEAHAYTVATSTTIDIPICTSDVFLRKYSRIPEGDVQEEAMLTEASSIETLKEYAQPAQRFVLSTLGESLELTGDNWQEEVERKKRTLSEEQKELNKQRSRVHREWNSIQDEIQRKLRSRWPEMHNRWHPRLPGILSEQKEDLLKTIESHPEFDAWRKLHQEKEELDEKILDLRKELARCERMLYLLKTLALQANLKMVASPEILERFEKLIALEAASLGTEASQSHSLATITARKQKTAQENAGNSNETDEQPAEDDRSGPDRAPAPEKVEP